MDNEGIVYLNNEILGSSKDLSFLRERLSRIVEERSERVVILDLDEERTEYLGFETVVAEYYISAAPETRYEDVIEIVDLVNSLGNSSIILDSEPL
ncbi:MAG: hypothetical protein DWQ47_16375 [Acidobacteria bacterium]|nr:MAG: hypothetical protein DWQ32_03775 [Acidobacteriota bacterium]REK02372.1 MAG: hypothetical protein DWQ38_08365 [Acidobacteriota bacterium]REK13826.1 MAG: hypothetical protein DWQ43_09465 [Acidobacteriota bacterium]REK41821.1 MAG: hypothetical protein DWQ47_16375 [Acidobacteriota bacterium]